jgi:rubrerythrin
MREESSYRFYEAAQKKVEPEDALQLLKKLCAAELRHRLKLEELQKTGGSEELEISTQVELDLFDEKEQLWPEVNSRSTYRDILNLALAKEKQAAVYYRTIAGRTSLRSVGDVFQLLAGEESEHAHWVKQMLAGAP